MRACNSCGPSTRALRPGHCGTVRLRRVGCRQDKQLGLLVLARTQFAHTLDRPGQGELGAAEALDEVAAAADAERLECAQLAVHGAVATRHTFAAHTVAGNDPLPLQQELGKRPRIGTPGEETIGKGPASLRGSDSRCTLARETSRP